MRTVNYWQQISAYESTDFVKRWYKSKHGRDLNAKRTKEIITCFTQGRAYFDGAKAVAPSVRPLLLYYGVLSLSKGIILLRETQKNDESLKPSHGLEAVEWKSILSKGIGRVLDLKIRATDGTFGELAAATRNAQSTSWWSAPRMVIGSFRFELKQPAFINDKTIITLDDLFSRDHRFVGFYERTTGRTTKVRISQIIADNTGIDVYILTGEGLKTNTYHLPQGVKLEIKDTRRSYKRPAYNFKLNGSDLNELKKKMPAWQYTINDGMYLLDDFSNGDRFSELLRNFLMSYLIGMLVRYFPSHWVALLRNELGDLAQPVILAAVDGIEDDYPKLVLENLG